VFQVGRPVRRQGSDQGRKDLRCLALVALAARLQAQATDCGTGVQADAPLAGSLRSPKQWLPRWRLGGGKS